MFHTKIDTPDNDNKDYWQGLYDGNRMIREAFTEAAFPAPMEQLQVLSSA